MQRELLGDNHPDVAETLSKIAFVQYENGNKRQGLATLQDSLKMYQRLFPGDHPEVARIMNREGFWLTLAGNYAAADRELHTALDMRRRLLDKTHPDIAASLAHLAILQVAPEVRGGRQHRARSKRDLSCRVIAQALDHSGRGWRRGRGPHAGLGEYARAEKLLTESDAILSKDPAALAAYRSRCGYYRTCIGNSNNTG